MTKRNKLVYCFESSAWKQETPRTTAGATSLEKGHLRAPYWSDFFSPWISATGKRGCWSLPEPKITHGTAGEGRLGRLTVPPLQHCCHLDKPRDKPSLHQGKQQQRSCAGLSWCSALHRAEGVLCQVSAASSLCGEQSSSPPTASSAHPTLLFGLKSKQNY